MARQTHAVNGRKATPGWGIPATRGSAVSPMIITAVT
jgi:hypothetical protein